MDNKKWVERFTTNLQSIMNSQGITQKELAGLAGISEGAMSRYCQGKQIPRGPILSSIAKALKCTVDELTGEVKGK